jgi:hypothetical protein
LIHLAESGFRWWAVMHFVKLLWVSLKAEYFMTNWVTVISKGVYVEVSVV